MESPELELIEAFHLMFLEWPCCLITGTVYNLLFRCLTWSTTVQRVGYFLLKVQSHYFGLLMLTFRSFLFSDQRSHSGTCQYFSDIEICQCGSVAHSSSQDSRFLYLSRGRFVFRFILFILPAVTASDANGFSLGVCVCVITAKCGPGDTSCSGTL